MYINEAFLRLAVEAGADSGILDPVQNDPVSALTASKPSRAVSLATDVVLGQDADCSTYIKAWRTKEFN